MTEKTLRARFVSHAGKVVGASIEDDGTTIVHVQVPGHLAVRMISAATLNLDPEPARALASPEEWAERALAWLKEQEWSAWRSSDGGREDFVGAECCPECSGMKAEDHYVGCAIDALLNSAPAPGTPAATPPKEDRHEP
jgi:hypothetical protein